MFSSGPPQIVVEIDSPPAKSIFGSGYLYTNLLLLIYNKS